MKEKICYICLSSDIVEDVEPILCDRCEQYFCYDCSYTFSIHYQYEGNSCYICADQNRRKPLNKREYKINDLGI